MVKIVGKYDLVHNSPETVDYLKGSGYQEKYIKRFLSGRSVFTITENDGVWTVRGVNAGIEAISTFRLGEVYDDPMPHGEIFKSVTRREGNTFITESTFPDGRKSIREYKFTEDGVISTVGVENGPKATRIYKRLE